MRLHSLCTQGCQNWEVAQVRCLPDNILHNILYPLLAREMRVHMYWDKWEKCVSHFQFHSPLSRIFFSNYRILSAKLKWDACISTLHCDLWQQTWGGISKSKIPKLSLLWWFITHLSHHNKCCPIYRTKLLITFNTFTGTFPFCHSDVLQWELFVFFLSSSSHISRPRFSFSIKYWPINADWHGGQNKQVSNSFT